MPGLRPSRLSLALAAFCLLGGCAHTRVVNDSAAVHVAISEYRLNPDDIRVKSGVVTIYVRNYGRATHDLVISQHGHPTDSTKPVAPGQSTALSLYLAPGKYGLASNLLTDRDLGLYGTLTVTS